MKISKIGFVVLLLLCIVSFGFAQGYFPDVVGYQTLICDLHTHTVFSDGSVWPTVRVNEAEREGLDVLVISDHIEYQPHKEDLPTNHNRPHAIAKHSAMEKNVLLRMSLKKQASKKRFYSGTIIHGRAKTVGSGRNCRRRCTAKSGFTGWKLPMGAVIIPRRISGALKRI